MEKDISKQLKIIDTEISKAISTINELEKKLENIKTDDEGNVIKEDCTILRQKFSSFNSSLQELTKMLVGIGIIENE
ncbi:hypothetical protein OXPF_33250 [Oxobacter pfennigii]|uniref:Uncharacterized protein n=1 Tax=Oxobacter pfennigii TaxID=36849 RepID=A0A0P8W599_9CLOT|nr:hypothetical protein [Oxobacter pfennigii]KPU43075.1 hypothetical protein OXPF_33250 [Oxobacter pfennigii]